MLGSPCVSVLRAPLKPLHRVCAASRLRLGCVSAASRLHLGCISVASRLHLVRRYKSDEVVAERQAELWDEFRQIKKRVERRIPLMEAEQRRQKAMVRARRARACMVYMCMVCIPLMEAEQRRQKAMVLPTTQRVPTHAACPTHRLAACA